jgi:short-subunit dehydrogenase involved in D-alanine esterification of teichoic acids
MMACDTNDRGMIESMVKAIVTEYTPQTPVLANSAAALANPAMPARIIPFRI